MLPNVVLFAICLSVFWNVRIDLVNISMVVLPR